MKPRHELAFWSTFRLMAEKAAFQAPAQEGAWQAFRTVADHAARKADYWKVVAGAQDRPARIGGRWSDDNAHRSPASWVRGDVHLGWCRDDGPVVASGASYPLASRVAAIPRGVQRGTPRVHRGCGDRRCGSALIVDIDGPIEVVLPRGANTKCCFGAAE